MTSVAGSVLHATPCCGALYSSPNYRSMNFSAWAYWTDGWVELRLMRNDGGLRRCRCGNFYLVTELIYLDKLEETDHPYTATVGVQDLPQAIAEARTPAIELVARLDLWRALNKPYREQCRTQQDEEDAARKAAWEAANPDARTWWQKLRKVPAPAYSWTANRPITPPKFETTVQQRDNMEGLLHLLKNGDPAQADPLTLAELHRELGQFEEAAQALAKLDVNDKRHTLVRLMKKLIREKEVAPVRFQM